MGGWAVAAALGALAGGLIAGEINVRPNMMERLLSLASPQPRSADCAARHSRSPAATCSPWPRRSCPAYVGFIDSQVTLVWALGVLIVALSLRPSGLLSRKSTRKTLQT